MSYSFTPGEQQIANANTMFNYFSTNGWTTEAICGMLGNLSWESSLDPTKWEYGMPEYGSKTGYGLAQWTPYQALNNECNQYNITPYDTLASQSELILKQSQTGGGGQYLETGAYPMSFAEFAQSTDSVDYLTEVFLNNYERAGVDDLSYRQINAMYWYDYFNNGSESSNTGNTPSASGNGSYITYTVQPGDTLSSIAAKYGVTVAELVNWNNISNPNDIYVGEVLKIYTNSNTSNTGNTPSTSGSGSSVGPIDTGIPLGYSANSVVPGNTVMTGSNAIVVSNSNVPMYDKYGNPVPNAYASPGNPLKILEIYNGQLLVLVPINADNTEWVIGFFEISTLPNSIQIDENSVTWNGSNNVTVYNSNGDVIYSLPTSQTVQYLYTTPDGNYACILYNDNNVSGWPLVTGYVSINDGTFSM